MQYTGALANLIDEFKKLPGIGPKSAQRVAFSILKKSSEEVERLSFAIREAKKTISYCSECFNLTTKDKCEICLSTKRDEQIICVLPEVKDLIALERTKEFNGLYHVLGGVISPLDGISADDLNVIELLGRIARSIESEKFSGENNKLEVLLAISPSTEGEATILYIKRLIAETINDSKIKITRLAYGLPVGADLDYVDELTLARAIEARQPA